MVGSTRQALQAERLLIAPGGSEQPGPWGGTSTWIPERGVCNVTPNREQEETILHGAMEPEPRTTRTPAC